MKALKHFQFNSVWKVYNSDYKDPTKRSRLAQFFKKITPFSNSNFDQVLFYVKYWKVEFDEDSNKVLREVGYDQFENKIVMAPYKGYNGFWASRPSTSIETLEKLNYQTITSQEFERDWEETLISVS